MKNALLILLICFIISCSDKSKDRAIKREVDKTIKEKACYLESYTVIDSEDNDDMSKVRVKITMKNNKDELSEQDVIFLLSKTKDGIWAAY